MASAKDQTAADVQVIFVNIHIEDEKTPLLSVSKQISSNTASKANTGTASVLHAALNTCNILLGVGILALPYALRQSGWIGLLFLAVLCVVMCYTGKTLGLCMSETGLHCFLDLGEKALGRVGHGLLSLVLFFELFSMVTLFLILEGTNLHNLASTWVANAPSPDVFMLLTAIITLPSACLKSLRILSYVSCCGVIASLFLLVVVIASAIQWVAASGAPVLHGSAPAYWINNDWAAIPICFGLISFSVTGHAVFPSIYSSMKEPYRFGRVMDLCYLTVFFVYGAFACAGFALYGSHTQEQIIMNLSGVAGLVATCLVLVSPLTKLALNLNPIALHIENVLFPVFGKSTTTSVAVRTSVMGAALFVAAKVPFFGLVVSLVGAIASTSLAAIFPPLIYLSIFRCRLGMRTILLNVFIVVIGVLCAISGTLASILEMSKSSGPTTAAP